MIMPTKAKVRTKTKAKPATKKRPITKKKITPRKVGSGRPSVYRKEHVNLVYDLALAGFTNEQMAECFVVSTTTLENWRKKNVEFLGAMRRGKLEADARVARSLYQRAIGVTVTEYRDSEDMEGNVSTLKTRKELPGDVGAQKFWLKNRIPDKWRENIGITDGQGGALGIHIHETLRPDDE